MIIFLRHGQTDYNAKNLMMGQLDIPLNDTGVQQAKMISTVLSNMAIATIHSSPLQRCTKTAHIIKCQNSLGGHIEVDAALSERNIGSFAGIKKSATTLEALETAEDVEPMERLAERAVNYLREYIEDSATHLVISHSGVYRALKLYSDFTFLPAKERLGNCEYVLIDKAITPK